MQFLFSNQDANLWQHGIAIVLAVAMVKLIDLGGRFITYWRDNGRPENEKESQRSDSTYHYRIESLERRINKLSDQSKEYLPKPDIDSKIGKLESKLDRLDTAVSSIAEKVAVMSALLRRLEHKMGTNGNNES